MKKRLAIILAAIISVSIFTSCGTGKKENNTTEKDYDSESGIDRGVLEANIIENGNSSYTIVYGNDATECEKFAAEQMRTYLQQITGVRLQTIQERALPNGRRFISVGQTDCLFETGIKLDDKALNGDGFIIKTVSKNLYISGANDRGTLYGVYDFLEKICGVKFLDINYEYVPESSTVTLYKIDVTEIPTFRYRACLTEATAHTSETPGGSSHGRNGVEVAEFYTKVRNTHEFLREESQVPVDEKYGGSIKINKDINQTHNNLTYVPVSEYYFTNKQKQENGHMFYVLDGKAIDICYSDGISEDGTITRTDDLTTAKAYLEGLKKYIMQNPDADYYTVGQEDIRTCCSCATCYERALKYGSTTASVILFYNAMAKEIQKWADNQPDLGGKKINLVAFAYLFSAQAPVKAVKNDKGEVESYEPVHSGLILSENLVLRIADINANVYYSLLDKANSTGIYGPEYFEKWKAVLGENGRTWYWGYLTTHAELMSCVPTLQKVQETLLGLEELGTEYALLQHNASEYRDYKAIMENYVVSKLLWNPHRDATALRREFMTYYYGIVADDIEEFTVNYEEWIGDIVQNKNRHFFNDSSNPTYIPLNFIDGQINILDNAIDKVNASGLGAAEKAELNEKILTVKIYPMYRRLINRSSYYSGDVAKQNEVTKEFFDLCDYLGVLWYGEHKSLAELKGKYPYL